MAEKAASDRVSAIRDAEMKGYLNTKKDMIYKKIMWELLNKDYLNQQEIGHQKPRKKEEDQRTKKKNNNGKRDSSAITEDAKENEKMKKQRLSAKINFDALEKMMNGGDEETVSGSEYRNSYEKNDNKNGSDENSIVAEEEEEEEEESEGVGVNNGYGDIMGLENEDDEDEVAGYGFDDEDYEGY